MFSFIYIVILSLYWPTSHRQTWDLNIHWYPLRSRKIYVGAAMETIYLNSANQNDFKINFSHLSCSFLLG